MGLISHPKKRWSRVGLCGRFELVISKQISGGDKETIIIIILLKKRTAGHLYSAKSSILHIQQ